MMNQSGGGNNDTTSEDQIRRSETEKLDETNKKHEQRIRNLETKALQNVNLYFIFQAVILLASTTTATSSTAACRHWWVPFTLSLVAAITNFLSLSTTMSTVLKSREELHQNVFKKWKRRLAVYLFICLFVGFSAVVMYGCYNILCRSGEKK